MQEMLRRTWSGSITDVFDDTNDSEFCLLFNVQETADPWVGAWSDAYGPMEITEDNYMLEMMVYKDVISSCALKLEAGDTDNIEVHVTNTVTDEWEKLFFRL